jgi:hypothetical protein
VYIKVRLKTDMAAGKIDFLSKEALEEKLLGMLK